MGRRGRRFGGPGEIFSSGGVYNRGEDVVKYEKDLYPTNGGVPPPLGGGGGWQRSTCRASGKERCAVAWLLIPLGIFCTLYFGWIFLEVRNFVLTKRWNCQEDYESIRRGIKQQHPPKYLMLMVTIGSVALLAYTVLGLILLPPALMEVGADVDPSSPWSLLKGFLSVVLSVFYMIPIGSGLYLIVCILLIREIYVSVRSRRSIRRHLPPVQQDEETAGKDR